jgi:hypothetical protein
MEINSTTIVNNSTGSTFSIPGDWSAEQVQANYPDLNGMRATASQSDGVRTLTFSPVTGAKGL